MEHLVALYLFRNKRCNLPGIGSLAVTLNPVQYLGGEEKITAPRPTITFEPGGEAEPDLVNWLSTKLHLNIQAAQLQVEAFCKKLASIRGGEVLALPSAGEFFSDGSGALQFRPIDIDPVFYPDVPAVTLSKIADHPVLVGDTESNAVEMKAYFADTTKKRVAAWKIIAILLFLISAAYLSWYFYYTNGGTGNIKKIEPNAEPASTYSTHP